MALRARRRAWRAGSRSRNLVALIDWLAPVHMNAAMTTTHSVLTMSPPARLPEKNGIASSPSARTRPTQAAAMVAVVGFFGDLPDDGPQHAAAVERQAGQQVEDGHDDVGHHELPDQRAGHPVRRDLGQAPADRAECQGKRRARAGHDELAAGGRCLPLDLRDAAERVEQDAAHRQAEAPGHHRVGQLVHEHGDVEQDHEGGGDHVPRVAAQRGGQVVGVDDDEDAGDDEPVRRHVHGDAERPRHDEAVLPAVGLLAPVRLLLLATCHITDATCIRRPRESSRATRG